MFDLENKLKRVKKVRKSGKIALGAVITCLCTVLNVLATIIPAAGYVFPASAGIFALIPVFESSFELGYMVYFSTSFLSLLLCINKFSVLNFVMFFGFYPIIRLKIKSMNFIAEIFKFFINIFVFNFSMILKFVMEIYIFSIPEESLYFYEIYWPYILLAIANVVFLMYNRCIDKFILFYFYFLQEKLKKSLKL